MYYPKLPFLDYPPDRPVISDWFRLRDTHPFPENSPMTMTTQEITIFLGQVWSLKWKLTRVSTHVSTQFREQQ